MKRILLVACCVLFMAFTACSSDNGSADVDGAIDAGVDAEWEDVSESVVTDASDSLDVSVDAAEASADGGDVTSALDAEAAAKGDAEAGDATVDPGCPVERRCSGLSGHCIGTSQRLVCSAAAVCGEVIECWSGPCTDDAGQSSCLPATREGAALQQPQPRTLAKGFVLLLPAQLPSDAGSAVAVRVAVEAADAGTRAAFGLYRGLVDAFGPRPAEQLAWTGLVTIPATGGEHDFRFFDATVPLMAEETYWVGASFERDRAGLAGSGATTMYYRPVVWEDGRAELPADLAPYPSAKMDNASPLGLWLLTRARSAQ